LEGERAGQESPVREESETRRERKKRGKKSLKAGRRQKENGSNPDQTTSRKDVLQEVSCRKNGRKKIFDMM
jgi:hypothetical protein